MERKQARKAHVAKMRKDHEHKREPYDAKGKLKASANMSGTFMKGGGMDRDAHAAPKVKEVAHRVVRVEHHHYSKGAMK